ncbi:pentapeptide repeat-containing protein [Bacillus suaedae]|uniref:pentapeptide repeat-containing protein n=1 Tax=Halalkalibacter suaedae TaxID=2822140 RepID=UPI003211B7DC
MKHANFSNAVIDHVHLFGTEFHNVVLPQEGDPNFKSDGQYKPVRFENCELTNGQVVNCNLTNMEITNCDINGLKINGVLIKDLIEQKS